MSTVDFSVPEAVEQAFDETFDSVTGARHEPLRPPRFVAGAMAVIARETPQTCRAGFA